MRLISKSLPKVSGEILEFNSALEAKPETVNEDAYGEGWMIKVKMSDPSELDALLDATAYGELIG